MKFIIPLMVLIIAGCGVRLPIPIVSTSNNPKDDEQMVYVKPKNKLYVIPWTLEGLEVPNWIADPSMNGKYEAAVGSCLLIGMSLSDCKEKAFTSAINEISRSRSVRVKNIFKKYETGDGVNYVDDTTKLEASASIDRAIIISTWTQPNTKEYYVWVVVK